MHFLGPSPRRDQRHHRGARLQMSILGGWSPKPAPVGPAAPSVLRHPHACAEPMSSGSFWCMHNGFGRAVQHTWVGFLRLRLIGYAELTERRSRLVGSGSPMKHGRHADFSKQTFLPGKTLARWAPMAQVCAFAALARRRQGWSSSEAAQGASKLSVVRAKILVFTVGRHGPTPHRVCLGGRP